MVLFLYPVSNLTIFSNTCSRKVQQPNGLCFTQWKVYLSRVIIITIGFLIILGIHSWVRASLKTYVDAFSFSRCGGIIKVSIQNILVVNLDEDERFYMCLAALCRFANKWRYKSSFIDIVFFSTHSGVVNKVPRKIASIFLFGGNCRLSLAVRLKRLRYHMQIKVLFARRGVKFDQIRRICMRKTTQPVTFQWFSIQLLVNLKIFSYTFKGSKGLLWIKRRFEPRNA